MKKSIALPFAAFAALAAGAAPVVRLQPGPFLDNMKRERAVMERAGTGPAKRAFYGAFRDSGTPVGLGIRLCPRPEILTMS